MPESTGPEEQFGHRSTAGEQSQVGHPVGDAFEGSPVVGTRWATPANTVLYGPMIWRSRSALCRDETGISGSLPQAIKKSGNAALALPAENKH